MSESRTAAVASYAGLGLSQTGGTGFLARLMGITGFDTYLVLSVLFLLDDVIKLGVNL